MFIPTISHEDEHEKFVSMDLNVLKTTAFCNLYTKIAGKIQPKFNNIGLYLQHNLAGKFQRGHKLGFFCLGLNN